MSSPRESVVVLSAAVTLALVLASTATPSFHGLVGAIAFDRPGDANVEIYAMDADGSNVRNLSNSPAGDHDPRYSPDGSRIAFQTNRDSNWEIYVMNADGSDQTRLTFNSASDELPAWTADGRIVFVSDRDGNAELYAMNADGGDVRRFTHDAADDPAFDYFPAPAPNGDAVAFISKPRRRRHVRHLHHDHPRRSRQARDRLTNRRRVANLVTERERHCLHSLERRVSRALHRAQGRDSADSDHRRSGAR
jgi:dipeptidyl aminopeptidase/acylaminoacyl peptidase